VEITGTAWDYSYPSSGSYGSILQSAASCILIHDSAGSQGTHLRSVDLEGNNTGTVGYFGPMTGGSRFENVRMAAFKQTGGIFGGLSNYLNNVNASANGGDGILLGSDSVVEGNTGIYGNGATGLHVFSGGDRITDINVSDNGLHNVWV
jgi:hypothetical protein